MEGIRQLDVSWETHEVHELTLSIFFLTIVDSRHQVGHAAVNLGAMLSSIALDERCNFCCTIVSDLRRTTLQIRSSSVQQARRDSRGNGLPCASSNLPLKAMTQPSKGTAMSANR